MRLVLDTNVVIAGLLWTGTPRRLLDRVIEKGLVLYSSPGLLHELAETLGYQKFAQRIARSGTTASALVAQYRPGDVGITHPGAARDRERYR